MTTDEQIEETVAKIQSALIQVIRSEIRASNAEQGSNSIRRFDDPFKTQLIATAELTDVLREFASAIERRALDQAHFV